MNPEQNHEPSSDLFAIAEALVQRQQDQMRASADTPVLSPEQQREEIISRDAARQIQAMAGNMM